MRCLMILAALAASPGGSRSSTVDRVESILSEYADSARFGTYRADDPGPDAADEQIRAILAYVRYDLGLTTIRPTVRLTAAAREARWEIVDMVRSARRESSRVASSRAESWPRKIDRATYREPAPLIRPSPSDPPAPIDPTPYPTPMPTPYPTPMPTPYPTPMPTPTPYPTPTPMPMPNQQPIMYYLVTAPAPLPVSAPVQYVTAPAFAASAVPYVAAPTVRCGLFGCRIH